MGMNKGTVASLLREEALQRSGDENLAKLLMKAAMFCDELRIENEITTRLFDQQQRERTDLPQLVKNLGVEIIGLRTDLQRYEREMKEISAGLRNSQAKPQEATP